MPLDGDRLRCELREARIAAHIAALRVMAAWVGVRHTEPACPPPSAPAPSRRPRPRPWPLARRQSGGDGR
jgi:hypothetical protein